MKATRDLVIAVLLAAALMPAAAGAHSLESLQNQLFEKEKYIQINNEPAPEFTLQDAGGKPVNFADFRGEVVVLHFIYAGCPDVCPLHAERIAQVQVMVNVTPMRDQVEFITVTTDPKRDTPELLRAYGGAHGLDPVNWKFLTSGPDRPEDTTRSLAEQFGHSFTVTGDGAQMHSVVTHVIDREGMLRANFHGLNFEPTNLVLFINGLVNDVHRRGEDHDSESSVWERIRSYF